MCFGLGPASSRRARARSPLRDGVKRARASSGLRRRRRRREGDLAVHRRSAAARLGGVNRDQLLPGPASRLVMTLADDDDTPRRERRIADDKTPSYVKIEHARAASSVSTPPLRKRRAGAQRREVSRRGTLGLRSYSKLCLLLKPRRGGGGEVRRRRPTKYKPKTSGPRRLDGSKSARHDKIGGRGSAGHHLSVGDSNNSVDEANERSATDLHRHRSQGSGEHHVKGRRARYSPSTNTRSTRNPPLAIVFRPARRRQFEVRQLQNGGVGSTESGASVVNAREQSSSLTVSVTATSRRQLEFKRGAASSAPEEVGAARGSRTTGIRDRPQHLPRPEFDPRDHPRALG